MFGKNISVRAGALREGTFHRDFVKVANPPECAFNCDMIQETLTRLARESMGVYLQAAANETAIRRMQEAARQDLGEAVPEEYAEFLRFSNGVQINNSYFKTAEHLVLENLDVPRPEIIVLGNDGNVAEFVFDRRDRKFHTIHMGFPDDRYASFGTFAEMLTTVLREQQVL